MVGRYCRIYNNLDQVDDRLVDFIPSPRKINLESINKTLRSTMTTLMDARVLFDHVIKHYPSTAEQLYPIASLVKFPDFENGVIKLLVGKAANLSRQERTAMAKMLRTTSDTPSNGDDSAPNKQSFAEETLCSEMSTHAAPHSLHWISPTSNYAEHLYPRAGIMFLRLRRCLNPTTLETGLFLQYCRRLCDASAVVKAVETPGRYSASFR
ncbi:hypothetical protein PHMEG_00010711 [Phytophthora megakarya]|uniref:Uncharacterized protein n=1 Tax=Phytophthora megakarya TaxID=4795 RepID=A0A225WD06_9STRA|nr:hypothetical protein PHMEG_00010711 [Phytophthora megakarya]